jgi:asparagine N-glycosylation enzyme membrane subunit Stt3
VGEGVFEPAEHAAFVRVVVATTFIVVLIVPMCVPMGVLGILMSGHRFSSVLTFPARQTFENGVCNQRPGPRTVIARQLPRYNSTGSVRIGQSKRHGRHVSADG